MLLHVCTIPFLCCKAPRDFCRSPICSCKPQGGYQLAVPASAPREWWHQDTILVYLPQYASADDVNILAPPLRATAGAFPSSYVRYLVLLWWDCRPSWVTGNTASLKRTRPGPRDYIRGRVPHGNWRLLPCALAALLWYVAYI